MVRRSVSRVVGEGVGFTIHMSGRIVPLFSHENCVDFDPNAGMFGIDSERTI